MGFKSEFGFGFKLRVEGFQFRVSGCLGLRADQGYKPTNRVRNWKPTRHRFR